MDNNFERSEEEKSRHDYKLGPSLGRGLNRSMPLFSPRWEKRSRERKRKREKKTWPPSRHLIFRGEESNSRKLSYLKIEYEHPLTEGEGVCFGHALTENIPCDAKPQRGDYAVRPLIRVYAIARLPPRTTSRSFAIPPMWIKLGLLFDPRSQIPFLSASCPCLFRPRTDVVARIEPGSSPPSPSSFSNVWTSLNFWGKENKFWILDNCLELCTYVKTFVYFRSCSRTYIGGGSIHVSSVQSVLL